VFSKLKWTVLLSGQGQSGDVFMGIDGELTMC
jgi:hypothetical protein